MTRPHGYADLREYLAHLEDEGLLVRVSEPVDKDTELVPIVRLQFRGLPEPDRRAFYFDNVIDSRGRHFPGGVAIGTFASSRAVYAAAVGVSNEHITDHWQHALQNPIDPVQVSEAASQEVVLDDLEELRASGGVDQFPHPISTPGFDNAPFLTSPYWVTKDPENGEYNVGTYRGMIKGPLQVGLQMDTPSQHIAIHLAKARRLGQKLPVAIVIGAVPAVGLASVQKLPYGISEYTLAGALQGRPLEVVRARTVDIDVPASAEVVVEGWIDPTVVAPEGPFGEASGYMGPRTWSPTVQVTAITHRRDPVIQAFISEFPPSESTLMRKIGFENVYKNFLRNACNIDSLVDVTFMEAASCNMMFLIHLQNPSPGQAWQALTAAAGYEPSMGKYIIAVDDDIDGNDPDLLLWALGFATQPHRDLRVIGSRLPRLDPSADPVSHAQESPANASAVLIDATRGRDYPPVSLPVRPFMEDARRRWESLGLPDLDLREPWSGYELGAWTDVNRDEAHRAVTGRYLETGTNLEAQSRAWNASTQE